MLLRRGGRSQPNADRTAENAEENSPEDVLLKRGMASVFWQSQITWACDVLTSTLHLYHFISVLNYHEAKLDKTLSHSQELMCSREQQLPCRPHGFRKHQGSRDGDKNSYTSCEAARGCRSTLLSPLQVCSPSIAGRLSVGISGNKFTASVHMGSVEAANDSLLLLYLLQLERPCSTDLDAPWQQKHNWPSSTGHLSCMMSHPIALLTLA